MPEPPPPTAADLVAELPARLAAQLEAGSSSHPSTLAVRCAEKGVTWVRSRLRRHGLGFDAEKTPGTPDWSDPLQRDAALARALYELYAANEEDGLARDKKDTANDLMEGVVGAGYDAGADTGAGGGSASDLPEPRPTAAASVVGPVRSALSERMRLARGL